MKYFTSDLHFYHKNVINFCNRPWPDVETMNKGLIEAWNFTVKPDDSIFILGDMFFCGSRKSIPIMRRLNGKKYLISGNHDWSKLPQRRAAEFGFEHICDGGEIVIGNQLVTLSHFPFKGDHTDDERYVDKRPKNFGQWLLHGHVHSAWQIKDKQINVGVDVWNYRPVSEDIIEGIIKKSAVGLEP